MIYAILGTIASLGGLGAFIYGLIKKNQSLKTEIIGKQVMGDFKELFEKLAKNESKIKEEERDYEALKKTFNDNNDSGDKSDK